MTAKGWDFPSFPSKYQSMIKLGKKLRFPTKLFLYKRPFLDSSTRLLQKYGKYNGWELSKRECYYTDNRSDFLLDMEPSWDFCEFAIVAGFRQGKQERMREGKRKAFVFINQNFRAINNFEQCLFSLSHGNFYSSTYSPYSSNSSSLYP